ncbi:L,D-transpeptidase family protein [Hamadaea tsunoensis]|uniref:L,D-transpeptidase family protein n=1 Tax=Hamadaea tsunoensis TaxID=53368 RepID=UPI00040C88D5|nr:L,D-transpeptidase family protein [Hamadaea tsunoensis]
MKFRYACATGAVLLAALTACAPAQPRSEASGPSLAPVSDTVPVSPSAAVAAPSTSPSAAPTTVVDSATTGSGSTAVAACQAGPHQREVEAALNKLRIWGTLTVDGKNTAADCAAIKKFQKRYGISPVNGRAGDTTFSVATRLAATDVSQCQAGTGLVACVDLTHQTTYIMNGGQLVWGPTVTRTGKPGYATPAGWFKVFDRSPKHWSNPYKVWLPYWQQFYNGDGFHETTTYIHDMSIGSHGCANLLHTDAVKYYSLLKAGTKVHLYGRRPGT